MANQYRVKTGVKLYTQVLEQVKSMIAQGVYKKGDLLPSEKELIEMMGVSRITVRKALQILSEAGVIETRKGKGSFVAPQNPELYREEARKQVEECLTQALEAARQAQALEPDNTRIRENVSLLETLTHPN